MDLKLTIILGLFLILLFGTVIFGLYIWWKKSVFTREKFAFAGLAAASALSVFVITSVFVAQEPPWLAIIGLIKQVMGLPYEPTLPPTIEQQILSFLLVLGFWWFIGRIHKQWSGAESFNQHEQRQKQQPSSLMGDTWLYLHPKRNQNLLAIYNRANQYRFTVLEGAVDSLVWHEQARELLQLSNDKYDFPTDGWHEQAQCWMGTHKGTGEMVVLACCEKQPEVTALQGIIEYAGKVRNYQGGNHCGFEFILALQEGDIDERQTIARQDWRIVSESKLLDGLVNFDNYFRNLRERVENHTLMGSDLTLDQVYTESRYKLDKHGDAQSGLETFLNDWLEEYGLRQIALLGEYGQGKSTASLMLSYHLMQRYQQNPRAARIPILFELRGKSPRTLREDELLSTWAGHYHINTHALLKLLVAGRLLLIFEGFDEVDLSGSSDDRIEHFKVMWGLCYPKAKIIVTGRPNYFLDDAELKTALGIQEPSLERPYCQAVHLAPFDFEEIEYSLRNIDAETRDGILELAAQNDRFYDIVSRPSMLHVVSILWDSENLAQYGERINSAVVMDLFVRHSYERQGAKNQKHDFIPAVGGRAKPAFMALNTRERAYFMEGIATYMLVNNLPNQITGRQLDDVVRLLVESIPDAVSQVDAQSGQPRKPLRQRYDLENQPDEIQSILTDVRACGLLVPDLSRSDSFKFGHKSFMEFMAGKVFAQWSLRKELPSAEENAVSALANTLGLKMRHVVRHAEVMAFAVEWIAEKAKDQIQAARILFALIFKECNVVAKIVNIWLKIALRWVYLLLIIELGSVGLIRVRVYFFILSDLWFYWVLNTDGAEKDISFFIATCLSIFFDELICLVYRGKLYNIYSFSENKIIGFFYGISMGFLVVKILIQKLEYFLCHGSQSAAILFFVSLLFWLGFSMASGLAFGCFKNKYESAWMTFRIWYAICNSAHLPHHAMARVVGKKPLCLLEASENNQSRYRTIAENLERLKERSEYLERK